jgi:hypothetical protein
MKRAFSAIVLLISITCLPSVIHHEFLLIGLLIHEHSAQPGQAENPSFPLEPKNKNLGLHTFCWQIWKLVSDWQIAMHSDCTASIDIWSFLTISDTWCLSVALHNLVPFCWQPKGKLNLCMREREREMWALGWPFCNLDWLLRWNSAQSFNKRLPQLQMISCVVGSPHVFVVQEMALFGRKTDHNKVHWESMSFWYTLSA